jgi:hypothetical protein
MLGVSLLTSMTDIPQNLPCPICDRVAGRLLKLAYSTPGMLRSCEDARLRVLKGLLNIYEFAQYLLGILKMT